VNCQPYLTTNAVFVWEGRSVARKTRVTIAWLMEGGRLAREWLMPVSRSEDSRLHPFTIRPPLSIKEKKKIII